MPDLTPQADAETLVEDGRKEGVAPSPTSVRSELVNAMAGLKSRFYGRGPERASAYINDDYVFVVLEGGLTRNEETLLAAGEDAVVRSYRLTFQEAMRSTLTEAVERITGRKFLDYHSQIVFYPPRTFEIFVLAPEEDG